MGEMKITNRKNDLGVVLQVEGRIDTYTAETFEQALLELLEKESVVTVDFEDVEYVSSAGLRAAEWTEKSKQSGKRDDLCQYQ